MTDKYQSKFLNLAELLRKRSAVYPMRDDSFIKLSEALDDFSHYLLETTDFNNFHPDSEILRGAEAFCDSPVFICGAMKSGTTSCTRLLDNHPDLLVMPGDSHCVNHIDKWTREQFPEIGTY